MLGPGKIKLRLRHLGIPLKRIDRGTQKVGSVSRVFRVIGYLPDRHESARREVAGRKTATQPLGGRARLIPLVRTSIGLSEIKNCFRSSVARGKWHAVQRRHRVSRLMQTVSGNTTMELILCSSRSGKLCKCISVSGKGI